MASLYLGKICRRKKITGFMPLQKKCLLENTRHQRYQILLCRNKEAVYAD